MNSYLTPDLGSMIVTTGNEVAGTRIVSYLGIVRGIVVRSPNVVTSFVGGIQSIFGGRIGGYEGVCESTRQQAYALMIGHARELGADAIIGMRYDATNFTAAATEVLAYGTAVKLGPLV